MELRDYIRVARKRWRVVLIATVLALAAATLLTVTTTPVYQATAQLFVSTSGTQDPTSLLQGSNFTQQRVKSYADIVTSQTVLQPVIDGLGLNTTPKDLAEEITADAPLDTVLINVNVNDHSPQQAAAIAQAVAKSFTTTVAELERPTDNSATPVKISVVRQPAVPTSPISPKPLRNIGLGLVLGLLVGFGLALVRELLDTTVKGESDVKAVTEVPVIGGISFDGQATKRPLIVQNDPHSPRAEAFRQLRTNLQFVDAANHPRSIVVTSSVPGEGKSTSAANLAITLAAAGSTVALVEGDLRRPRVADYMGLEGAVGLTNVLIGQASIEDVLQPWGNGRLQVLACGPIPPNPSELLGSQPMDDALRLLEKRFDYVIIDCPPLLPVTDAAVVSRLAGGSIIVAGSGKINRDQLTRALETLEALDARMLGVLLNMLPTKGPDSYAYYGYGYSYESARPTTGKASGPRSRNRERARGRELKRSKEASARP